MSFLFTLLLIPSKTPVKMKSTMINERGHTPLLLLMEESFVYPSKVRGKKAYTSPDEMLVLSKIWQKLFKYFIWRSYSVGLLFDFMRKSRVDVGTAHQLLSVFPCKFSSDLVVDSSFLELVMTYLNYREWTKLWLSSDTVLRKIFPGRPSIGATVFGKTGVSIDFVPIC